MPSSAATGWRGAPPGQKAGGRFTGGRAKGTIGLELEAGEGSSSCVVNLETTTRPELSESAKDKNFDHSPKGWLY